MALEPIRLVVVDVDGTLLRRDGTVGDRTLAAVRAANDRGVVLTLATGRGFPAALPIAEQLGIRVPLILHNGALVKDSATGEVLHHRHLPLASALEALAIIRRHGCAPIVYENAFGGETLLTGPAEHDSETSIGYLHKRAAELRRRPADDFDIAADPIQLLVMDRPEKVAPLLADLRSDHWRVVTSVTTVTPGARLVEILHPECSKVAAIRHLAELWGYDLRNVLAVGDNYNDLEMIVECAIGVAMANAPDDVRAAADWVTASNQEDGVALALERFVLVDAAGQPESGIGDRAPTEQAGHNETLHPRRPPAGRPDKDLVEVHQEDDRLTRRHLGRPLE